MFLDHTYINEYGVCGEIEYNSHYDHIEKDGTRNSMHFTPKCCCECENCDQDFGEYGERLTPKYCILNIRMPIRKGTCKKQKTDL
jgi:hypothetical protein